MHTHICIYPPDTHSHCLSLARSLAGSVAHVAISQKCTRTSVADFNAETNKKQIKRVQLGIPTQTVGETLAPSLKLRKSLAIPLYFRSIVANVEHKSSAFWSKGTNASHRKVTIAKRVFVQVRIFESNQTSSVIDCVGVPPPFPASHCRSVDFIPTRFPCRRDVAAFHHVKKAH